MQSLIHFYFTYGHYLDGYFIYARLVIWVLLGIVVANNFNDNREKDLTGKKKLLATLFMSSLIYFGMIAWANINFIYFTGIIFGFGANKLIKKWYKNKVWDKYDFISKGEIDGKDKK